MKEPRLILYAREGTSMQNVCLEHARKHFSPERIFVPVLEQDDPWWRPALASLPPENIIVQPFDRGTGISVLAALLHMLTLDPKGSVTIAPTPNSRGAAFEGPLIVGPIDGLIQQFHDVEPSALSTLVGGYDHLEAAYIELLWLNLDDVFRDTKSFVTAA